MRTISNGDTLVFVDFDNLSGPTAGLFREFLRATLKPEHRNVELDLSRATFMDSEGLGAVMSAHKAVAGRGGGVRIKGAPPMIRELFRITRLDTLIEFTPPA
ncbi:MAG: STAS domain-containing protein [Verrucomicrobiales bacterium]|nr:STAS domain-containing protein [Verrucomicrobiales bacterium]